MACQVRRGLKQVRPKSRLLSPLLRRQHRGFFLQWISFRMNLCPTLQSRGLQRLLQVSECQLTQVLGVSPRLHARAKALVQQLRARRRCLFFWSFSVELQEFALSFVRKAGPNPAVGTGSHCERDHTWPHLRHTPRPTLWHSVQGQEHPNKEETCEERSSKPSAFEELCTPIGFSVAERAEQSESASSKLPVRVFSQPCAAVREM